MGKLLAAVAGALWLASAGAGEVHERLLIIWADQYDADIYAWCVDSHGRTAAGAACLDRETRLAREARGHLDQEVRDLADRERIFERCKRQHAWQGMYLVRACAMTEAAYWRRLNP